MAFITPELYKNFPWTEYIGQFLDPSGSASFITEPGDDGEPSYERLVWMSTDIPKPSEDEYNIAAAKAKEMLYATNRRNSYPSVVDQLDMMFHNFDLWKSVIQEIKDTYPKP